ncbi:MAG TPA: phage antirepressor N-terminal domain-containing protein, partial [Promineifilum sp.]|nr:phage antirepressor N-terminal domain-containing protein [Promineifilum sp.]
MNDMTITVIDQRGVDFYGDELTAVRASDGQIYVSVRHLCNALELNQRPQVLRIQRNSILADGYQGEIKMITPGGLQRLGMLRVDLIPLWLAGVSLQAVKESSRPKLERFQREAAKVLWEAFQQGRLTAELDFDSLLAQDTPEAQAYK